MSLVISPDLEALIEKRIATGDYASADEVIRRALEAQEEAETWSAAERSALDEQLDASLAQSAKGNVCGPQSALEKLSLLRAEHLGRRKF